MVKQKLEVNELEKINFAGGTGDLFKGTPADSDYKDNLYLAVNGAWQVKAKISPDKASAGASMILAEEIEKNLMQDFKDFADGKKTAEGAELKEAVKLYKLVKDAPELDPNKENPLFKDLKLVQDLNSLADLNGKVSELAYNNFDLPFYVGVSADMKDTSKNVVLVDGPALILPDKSYYEADNESGKKLLAKYAEVAEKLLVMIGYEKAAAKETVDKALKFDKSIVPIVKSSEEWADYTKIYNPMKFADFVDKSQNFNLKSLVEDQIKATPDKVIVMQPRYLDNLDKLVTEETFENIKAWIIVKYVFGNASVLDENFRQTVGEYDLAKSGAKELSSRVKYAYHFVSDTFNEVVGMYYGQKYFGEKAKADVRSMIEKMISIYKQRLADNDWLSEATKEKAIVKLNKIVIKVGYPDKVEEIYKKLKVDESASLYENVVKFNQLATQEELADYHKPVDRTRWLMPGHLVNACYDPQRNDITFPAAILQAPFYSLQQTSSENYGGAGAVIAHEISHAFDNNGAQFDEYGNMNDWWTKADYAKFKELTQKMITEFDGIPYAGGKVNGTLVVSENIADVAGLRCAIEAAKLEPDYDSQEFFINWTKTWQFKGTQELVDRYLATDVHAPEPLRANVQAQNLDEFFTAFDVKPGDGMWLEPDKRVSIW